MAFADILEPIHEERHTKQVELGITPKISFVDELEFSPTARKPHLRKAAAFLKVSTAKTICFFSPDLLLKHLKVTISTSVSETPTQAE